ncbi:unnamed protein product [Durusdinium trenchii]|uniref:Uncharacterized protein n=1 Tax=Durusdinium trenchii TaxID=1381693 RepID=A0ABP0S1M0_9DINO
MCFIKPISLLSQLPHRHLKTSLELPGVARCHGGAIPGNVALSLGFSTWLFLGVADKKAAEELPEMLAKIRSGEFDNNFFDGDCLVKTPTNEKEAAAGCILDKVGAIVMEQGVQDFVNDLQVDLAACCTKDADDCLTDLGPAYSMLTTVNNHKAAADSVASAVAFHLLRAVEKRISQNMIRVRTAGISTWQIRTSAGADADDAAPSDGAALRRWEVETEDGDVARAIRLNADVRALQFFVREDGSSRFPDHMFRFAVKHCGQKREDMDPFRQFCSEVVSNVSESLCVHYEREIAQLTSDLVFCRSQLSRCADLLAQQLDKEKTYRDIIQKLSESSLKVVQSKPPGLDESVKQQLHEMLEAMHLQSSSLIEDGFGQLHEHKRLAETHLMTSAELQNQGEAIRKELDAILELLKEPPVRVAKAPMLGGHGQYTSQAVTPAPCVGTSALKLPSQVQCADPPQVTALTAPARQGFTGGQSAATLKPGLGGVKQWEAKVNALPPPSMMRYQLPAKT